jgi:hypothetical protein
LGAILGAISVWCNNSVNPCYRHRHRVAGGEAVEHPDELAAASPPGVTFLTGKG